MGKLSFIMLAWIARAAAVASVLFLLLYIISDLAYVSRCSFSEILLFVLFPIGVILGLLLGLKYELLGAIVCLFAFFLFYLLHFVIEKNFPKGAAFMLFASPAILFLISWLASSKKYRKFRKL